VSITAEEVSIRRSTGTAVEPSGASSKAVVIVIESAFAPKNDTVTTADVAVYVSAFVCDAVAEDRVTLSELIIACDGTELSTPRPNAATATSAMRLKFVVVDICFLSIVVSKYFLEAALR
jgi:hypothetical protein